MDGGLIPNIISKISRGFWKDDLHLYTQAVGFHRLIKKYKHKLYKRNSPCYPYEAEEIEKIREKESNFAAILALPKSSLNL